jgi:hypothetical protein
MMKTNLLAILCAVAPTAVVLPGVEPISFRLKASPENLVIKIDTQVTMSDVPPPSEERCQLGLKWRLRVASPCGRWEGKKKVRGLRVVIERAF